MRRRLSDLIAEVLLLLLIAFGKRGQVRGGNGKASNYRAHLVYALKRRVVVAVRAQGIGHAVRA